MFKLILRWCKMDLYLGFNYSVKFIVQLLCVMGALFITISKAAHLRAVSLTLWLPLACMEWKGLK